MQGYKTIKYLDGLRGRRLIMARYNIKNSCGRIGEWLADTVADRVDNTTAWTQRHIASCPRCRRLAIGNSRIRLALLLIKTQPHKPDLLMQANRRAIGVLKRSLRELPQAERLRHISPKPALLVRLSKYTQAVGHAAACLLVLLLLRMGIFSSLAKVDKQGQEFAKAYSARLTDADLLDDMPSV